ncbi:ATP/GTP-binding protein [Acidiferrobacter sp.]|uniref:AAA family ATPase n=1 Tax=Acidiferrobacter sp. TaxID=1872107 RepID=UPI00262E993E|nr:ATP-binding protein [Acidiferrobacter sp.]
MLIEFSVANFRSIGARQTVSLVASPDTAHPRNVIAESGEGLRLLRSAAIYGPNAAGKSNLGRALKTLVTLVQLSATGLQEGQPLPVTPFLLSETAAKGPSEFEILFIADDGVRYQYGCAVDAERVHKEWLVAYPHGRRQRWFERVFVADSKSYDWWFGSHFRAERARRRLWQDSTRANALFLSTAIQLNNEQLRPVFTWLTQKLIVLLPGSGVNFNPFLSLSLLREASGQEKIMQYMQAADIGIDRLELVEEERPSAPPVALLPGGLQLQLAIANPAGVAPQPPLKQLRVRAWHKRVDSGGEVALDLSDESDGTRKLFEFAGGWLRALEWGAALFVDELDLSLHPHMTRFLVGLFHGRANDKNSQLVFTTHDTTLLDTDVMRRDQIWFVEKDKQSASHFYSLLEYSPRKEEALERGYLKGRYGAIPFIGPLGAR